MPDITVVLPDESMKTLPEGSTIRDLAESIGSRLAAAAVAGKVDGRLVDTSTVLAGGEKVEIVTDKAPEALGILRHSAAHVMAEAVLELFPMAKFAIGPAIEDGFYYDFDVERPFTPDDLEAIEARMRQIVAEAQPFTRGVMDKVEAEDAFKEQPYKEELVRELPADEEISTYTQGAFTDLCRGPHVPDTSWVRAFKLMKVAGAYWRGDSDRPMLQRIYGTAWFSDKDLAAYLTRLEEAERRDHRKLGKELDLFSFHEVAGAGLPLYHPKGARVLRLMQEWLRGVLYERGYVEAITPHIYRSEVWKISGHYDFYGENMYFFNIDEGDGRVNEYAVKPMNCPGHVLIFQSDVRSYRDLPMRISEFGTVYRHELSGVVHGLMRARGFTQDDAHIFCSADQVHDEVMGMLDFVDYVMGVFGFEYSAEVSTRPEKSIGDDARLGAGDQSPHRDARGSGRPVRHQRGRRRLLRSQDRHQAQGRDRPHVAVLHHPGGLQLPGAFRPHVPHGREHRGHPVHAAPHDPRLDGEVLRDPHRALRRRVPRVARARAGRRHPHRRPPQRLRQRSEPRALGAGRAHGGLRRQRAHAHQDRQGSGAEGALHAGRGRPRAGGAPRRREGPYRGRPGSGGDRGLPGQGPTVAAVTRDAARIHAAGPVARAVAPVGEAGV